VFSGNSSKRETEREAALFVVREVLDLPTAKIVYEESGRPYIEDCSVSISISHAHDKLALLFSDHQANIGIDIEKVRDKVLKIKERFLSPTELTRLGDSSIEEYILYWAIKEAVYKAGHIAGLSFADQIIVDPFVYSKDGGEVTACIKLPGSEKKFCLRYKKIEDYMLAHTFTA
jgi:phosphopantetheinyl transferase